MEPAEGVTRPPDFSFTEPKVPSSLSVLEPWVRTTTRQGRRHSLAILDPIDLLRYHRIMMKFTSTEYSQAGAVTLTSHTCWTTGRGRRVPLLPIRRDCD